MTLQVVRTFVAFSNVWLLPCLQLSCPHPFIYACPLGDQPLHLVAFDSKYVMLVWNVSKPFIPHIMCPRNYDFLILIPCLSLIYLSFPFYVETWSVHGILSSLLQKHIDFVRSLLFIGEEFIQYSLL